MSVDPSVFSNVRCNCWAVASGFQCEVIGSLGFHTSKRWLCFVSWIFLHIALYKPYIFGTWWYTWLGYSFKGTHLFPLIQDSFVASTSQEKAEMRKMQVIVTAVWEPQFFGSTQRIHGNGPRFAIKINQM